MDWIRQVVLAVLEYFGRAITEDSTARDADRGDGRLRRAGIRVRDWLRKQDGPGPGGEPGAGRS